MDGKPVYFINQWPECLALVEKFIRVLDKEREASAMQDSTKRWRERKRVVPSNQKTSPFRALPEDMPINYFEPNFYNRLQPHLHMRITNNTIALLPNVEESFRGTPDERLSDTNFNNKYGDQVLKRYNIPSKGELGSESNSEDNSDEDGDIFIDDDDDAMQEDGLAQGGPEVTAHQNKLAASFSAQIIG